MILLCVSDIQGHLEALRAVLATAERRAFHKLLVAGDLIFPPPWSLTPAGLAEGAPQPVPLETWRRLTAAGAVMVQGASDRALAVLDVSNVRALSPEEQAKLERFRKVRSELGDVILERIRRLPTHERIPLEDGKELLLVHGSPVDPFEPMSFDLDEVELNNLLGDDPADIVVCGMSHTPFDKMVGDTRVINVGSVGDAPDNREPGQLPVVAHATWIESTPSGILVEQISVPLI